MDMNKTIEVRSGEELVAEVIDPVMKDHIAGLEGVPEIRQFAGGHSNLVFIGEHFPAHRLRYQALERSAERFGCSVRCVTSSSWAFAAGLDEARLILDSGDADALVCATASIS